jgi:hypothetical protein
VIGRKIGPELLRGSRKDPGIKNKENAADGGFSAAF